MASVTVNLTGVVIEATAVNWNDDVSLGSTFDANNSNQTLDQVRLFATGVVRLSINGAQNDFTPAFEATGRIIFEASDGEMLEVMIANADMTEPYEWTPANSEEVVTFANHVRTLTNQTATLTLTDDDFAPVFSDDAGDDQNWEVGTEIYPVAVPEARGQPDPTYAVVGSLPAGLSFEDMNDTQIINLPAGAPDATEVGWHNNNFPLDPQFVESPAFFHTLVLTSSGSVRIQLSETGRQALLPGPLFTDDFEATGRIRLDAERLSDGATASVTITGISDATEPYEWTPSNSSQVITFVNLANADGITTTLTLMLSEPPEGAGLIRGTPTGGGGSGTVIVRATNSEGSDDWMLAYTLPEIIPDTPTVPTVSAIQRFQATINWVAPNSNGADITSYDLEWRQGSTGTWTEVSDLTGTSHTLTGLDANTAYQARVRATNSEGNSDYSTAVSFTTTANSNPIVTITTLGQTVNGNSTLALVASATDADSDTLTYLWSASPDVGSFDDEDTASTDYNVPPPITNNRSVTLTLTVTDPYGGSGDNDVGITVRQNAAPSVTINTLAMNVASEQDVPLSSTIFDTDHPTSGLTILWTAPQGSFNNANVTNPTWTAPAVTAEMLVVLTLTVSDGVAATVVRTVTMTVKTPLILSDYEQGGRQFDVLALFESGQDVNSGQNTEIYQSNPPYSTTSGSLIEGDRAIDDDTNNLQRVRANYTSTNNRLVLFFGPGTVADYFADEGDPGHDLTIGFMSLDGLFEKEVATISADDINENVIRFDLTATENTILQGIETDDRFIIALWRATEDYTVDAGDVSWAYALPQPTITHHHAHRVNAGDVSWSFVLPEPAVIHGSIATSTEMITILPERIFTDTASQKRWDFNGDDAILLTNQQLYGVFGALYLRRLIAQPNVNGFEFRMIFSPTSTFPSSQQGDDLVVVWEMSNRALGFDQGENGVERIPGPDYEGNYLQDSGETYRWVISAGVTATECEDFFFTDLDTSVSFTMTLRALESLGTDYEVDAGDTTWIFVLPEPTSTKVTEHRVDAGDVSWAYALPQPTGFVDHQVNAGDVGWSFVVPQVVVEQVTEHRVDSGNVAWQFDLPEPEVFVGRGVDVGDVSFVFDVPQPTVILNHFHRVDVDDVVWAFDLSRPTTFVDRTINTDVVQWTFDLLQPAVTKVTEHRVDAGDVNWVFTLPQLSVSLSGSHRVNATSVVWAFDLPEPVITRMGALLLSSYDRTGKSLEMLALIQAAAPNDLFQQSPLLERGTLLEGEVGIGPDNVQITRIRKRNNGQQIIIREANLDANGNDVNFNSANYFNTGGAGNDLVLDIVTLSGTLTMVVNGNIDSSGTNATQVRLDIDSSFQAILNDIVENDRFIIALWRPSVEHEVNSGDVAWSFDLPELIVTKVTEHRVDVGSTSWAFALPEPSATLNNSHEVSAGSVGWFFVVPQPFVELGRQADAGDVQWSFNLPQPSVIRVASHQVDVGAVQWTFTLAEPVVTKGLPLYVDAGDVGWSFAVSEPTTHVDYSVDAGDVGFALDLSEPVVTKVTEYRVAAGVVDWAFVVPESDVNYVQQRIREVNLGSNPFGLTSIWEGAFLLDRGLIEGQVTAYLRVFGASAVSLPVMRLASSPIADPNEVGPEFTSVLEEYVGAITLREEGGSSFTLPGPTYAGNLFSDASDPYVWNPGGDTLNNFHSWILGLGSGNVIITFDDGLGINVDAGVVSWAFDVPEPVGTKARHLLVDWSFAISDLAVTHSRAHRVDVGDVSWSLAVSEPTVSHARAHQVGAGGVDWAFVLSEPSATLNNSHRVSAGDVNWSFITVSPSVSKGLPLHVDAGDVGWSFVVSEPIVAKTIRHLVNTGSVSWSVAVSDVVVRRFIAVNYLVLNRCVNGIRLTSSGVDVVEIHSEDRIPVVAGMMYYVEGLLRVFEVVGSGEVAVGVRFYNSAGMMVMMSEEDSSTVSSVYEMVVHGEMVPATAVSAEYYVQARGSAVGDLITVVVAACRLEVDPTQVTTVERAVAGYSVLGLR